MTKMKIGFASLGNALAIAVVVLGLAKVALASAICDLDVRKDTATNIDYKFNSCPTTTVCYTDGGGGSHYCQGGSWNFQGRSYGYCRCEWTSENAPCLPGFSPDPGQTIQGKGKCVPFTCVNPCEDSWVPTADPEVKKLECSCP